MPHKISKKIDSRRCFLESGDVKVFLRFSTIHFFSFQIQSLICPQSPWNITALYPQLERFCNEREAENDVKPCRLRAYLHSFIVNVFIDQFKCKLETLAEQALNEQDAWRVLMYYPCPVSAELYLIFCFFFVFFSDFEVMWSLFVAVETDCPCLKLVAGKTIPLMIRRVVSVLNCFLAHCGRFSLP